MEGISKERLKEIGHIYMPDSVLLAFLKECTELKLIPEYKELPQTVCVQEGTVINISDGYGRGKWLSTKEGWIPYTEEKWKELNK